jgi:hypothetical protein
MRANEFITEASIFSRGTYSYGHKVKISTSKSGLKLLDAIQNEIDDFKPAEELEWVEPNDNVSTMIMFGREGNSSRYFKRKNGDIFGITGSDNTIEKSMVHANAYNRGDIAEGLLGAAITAKLILRGGNKIGNITVENVRGILGSTIKNGSQELSLRVSDKNSQIADNIIFTLKLPTGSMEVISKPKNWSKFEDLFNSAVHYANSSDAERYSNYFYTNGKIDEVRIVSDGVSDQKGRKTDVQAVVSTTDPITGQVKSRQLKNVDISLKADSIKYGQHSAGGLTKSKEVWLDSAKRLFEPLGIIIEMPAGIKREDENSLRDFWIKIYEQASKKLNKELANASANKETTFIEKIADLINHHGSAGNQYMKLVSFEKGQSSIHSFSQLKRKLVEQKIDLTTKMTLGPRSGLPYILIYNKKDPSRHGILTKIRFYLTKTAATSYFDKGTLLHNLTRIDKATPPHVAQQQTGLGHNGGPSLDAKSNTAKQNAPAQQQQAAQKAPVAAQQAPVAAQQQQAVQQQAPVAAQQQQVAQPAADPAKQKVDLSRSPLTAKWLSGR